MLEETAAAPLASPLPWPGGKSRLARWIVDRLPPHSVYVEPFAGSLAVLLAKPPAGTETVNDVDGGVVHFWRTLRHPALGPRLRERLARTLYARAEWEAGQRWADEPDPVERAALWFTLHAQSYQGLADAWGYGAGGGHNQALRWSRAVDRLPAIAERLRRVQVEHGDWETILDRHDGPGTMFYCDPPYLQPPRAPRDAVYGPHSTIDHQALLSRLRAARGMVALSGYPSPLYAEALAGWTCHTRTVRLLMPGGGTGHRPDATRTECLWLNPAAARAAARQMTLWPGDPDN